MLKKELLDKASTDESMGGDGVAIGTVRKAMTARNGYNFFIKAQEGVNAVKDPIAFSNAGVKTGKSVIHFIKGDSAAATKQLGT